MFDTIMLCLMWFNELVSGHEFYTIPDQMRFGLHFIHEVNSPKSTQNLFKW